MEKLPFKREFSAGGVVFKKEEDSLFFLLGKHSGYHKWVLPKGIIEKDERALKAAQREIKEETGVEAEPVKKEPIHVEHYFYVADYEGQEKTRVSKTVKFFLFRFLKGSPEKDHGWEMEKSGWFDKDEALSKMAFSGEKEALEKAYEAIRELP